MFRPGYGCQDPGGDGGNAEDHEDASETPWSSKVGLKCTSNIAAPMKTISDITPPAVRKGICLRVASIK